MLGLNISKEAILALVFVGFLALAGTGFWMGTSKLSTLVEDAGKAAAAKQDALWEAQLAKSNATAAQARAEQAIRAAQLEALAAEANTRAALAEGQLEKRNAELPNPGVCSLDRDRWRLLNTPE